MSLLLVRRSPLWRIPGCDEDVDVDVPVDGADEYIIASPDVTGGSGGKCGLPTDEDDELAILLSALALVLVLPLALC